MPSTYSEQAPSSPLTIAQLSDAAKQYEFNATVPLGAWLRTSDYLLKEAAIYEDDGNLGKSYMLIMRYIDLVVEKLSKHPEAKLPKYKDKMKQVYKLLPSLVDKLETLKPRIKAQIDDYEREQPRVIVMGRRFGGDGVMSRSNKRSGDYSESDPAVAGKRLISSKDDGNIPVKLFHKESKRRDMIRRSDHDRSRRTRWSESGADDDNDMRRRMEDTRRRMNMSTDSEPMRPRKLQKSRSPARSFKVDSKPPAYSYPTIKKSTPFSCDDRPRSRDRLHEVEMRPPPPPLKTPIENMDYDTRPPSLPSKIREESSYRPSIRGGEKEASPRLRLSLSPIDGDSSDYTFKAAAYLEKGTPLRHLFIPPGLREDFLCIAAPNTRNNIETCGILCGTLISNALFVSRLVIPEQEGTSDTCEMTNEGALFEYCDKEDLMVLGWIHTHPTQSCFMSSRDLHTHCGFQVMMPEAIAIVCAPSRTPSYGVFRLTDPPGMPNVLNCTKTGLFHPHPETDTYTDAMKPGHVHIADIAFETVDLRT